MQTEQQTELFVNLNLLPEPHEKFVSAYPEAFNVSIPCNAVYHRRACLIGLLLLQTTPKRLLAANQKLGRYSISPDGIACIRFTAAWPARKGVLIAFIDDSTLDPGEIVADTERLVCFLTSDAENELLLSEAVTTSLQTSEFVEFAETFITSIVSLVATASPAPVKNLGGIGDMSWMSLMAQCGVNIQQRLMKGD